MSESCVSALLTALLQRDTVRSLTIHIAKTLPPPAACCEVPLFRQALKAGGYQLSPEARGQNYWGLPLGQIVAVVWLDEVQQITPAFQVEEPERSFGLFSPGRYAWIFSEVYRLATPRPARGSLGVWEWHPPAGFWSELQAVHDRIREGVQR